MTPERKAKFQRVAANRQLNLTVLLENVHDPHNIGAVMRSCDSVGVGEIFVLYTEPQLKKDRLELGKRTAAGALKWIDVNFYTDAEACFAHLRQSYERVLSTYLSEEAVSIYETDLTGSVALLFGNEHDGLSEAALAHSDGNILIPQVGMVESLNISVACAVTLYEAFRQRQKAGAYTGRLDPPRQAVFEEYLRRHETGSRGRSHDRLDP